MAESRQSNGLSYQSEDTWSFKASITPNTVWTMCLCALTKQGKARKGLVKVSVGNIYILVVLCMYNSNKSIY